MEMSIESWNSGQVRADLIPSLQFDPSSKDEQGDLDRRVIFMVEGKKLYSNSMQLIPVSDWFRTVLQRKIRENEKLTSTALSDKPLLGNYMTKSDNVNQKKPEMIDGDKKVNDSSEGEIVVDLPNERYKHVYEFLLAIQPQSLLQDSDENARTINTKNVCNLLRIAKKFGVNFLWDECLIFLKNDLADENVLCYYSKVSRYGLLELEEIFFAEALDRLSMQSIDDIEVDPHFAKVEHEVKCHFRACFQKRRECVICGANDFPFRIVLNCQKCREGTVLEHRFCRTLGTEFVQLNTCTVCRNKIADVQYEWGPDEAAPTPAASTSRSQTKAAPTMLTL